jgi:virulence-associated protein VapD
MSATRTQPLRGLIQSGPSAAGIGHNQGFRRSMYAITFDMDTTALQASYHNPSWQNAYFDIGRTLSQFGFTRQQGSVYFGDDTVDAVRCVLAVQDLAKTYVWFSPSVRDIRMLRIEDNNDLMPAVSAVTS